MARRSVAHIHLERERWGSEINIAENNFFFFFKKGIIFFFGTRKRKFCAGNKLGLQNIQKERDFANFGKSQREYASDEEKDDK